MKRVILYHARKHPSLATVLLAVSAALFMAICSYVFLRPITHGVEQMRMVAMTPHDLMVRNNSVSYPVFKGEKVNGLVKGYATEQSEAFIAAFKDAANVNPRNRLALDYTVLHQGSRIAVVQFVEQKQYADRPTEVSHHRMVLDLVAQKELSFTDLFKPEANVKERVGTLLYDYFKQEHASSLTPAQLFALFRFTPDRVGGFWVNDKTISFTINPWQLDAKKDYKTIQIAKSVLADVLRPEYAAADPGEEVAQPADFAIMTQPKPGDTIDPNQKMIALTFDDGPGRYTERVLNVLRQYRAHGTFFVLGQQVGGRADIVKRMVDEGHEIGNHSWDHALLPPLSHDQLQREINETQQAVKNATGGYTPVLMRPPYGALSPGVVEYLHSQGLTEAMWNADTEDWMHKGDSQTVYDAIMGAASDGRNILLHDIHLASVEATERAVPELVSQGYQLVTVSQLERYR